MMPDHDHELLETGSANHDVSVIHELIEENESDHENDDFDHIPDASAPMSDRDWMHVMNPSVVGRNGEEPFHWVPFIREFVLHLLHPLLTPFVWMFLRTVKGSEAASLFLSSHLWTATPPPSTGPSTIKAKLLGLLAFFFIQIFAMLFPYLLFVLAFSSHGSQNYMHEAVFAVMFRTVWSLSVGIKYGLYSEKFLAILPSRAVPADKLLSEQIMTNWSPDLDRLMFELRVASVGLPTSTSKSIIYISKHHPMARYCLQCQEIGDTPLCLIRPSLLTNLLQKLPGDNFHRVFWSKPPPAIPIDGKAYKLSVLEGSKESCDAAQPFTSRIHSFQYLRQVCPIFARRNET
jgi:hypothetical protein